MAGHSFGLGGQDREDSREQRRGALTEVLKELEQGR